MAETHKLTDLEKIFLAGCIKAVVLADGWIDEMELEDVDRIIKALKFDDFEAVLTRFEEQIHDLEGFWGMAEKVIDGESRSIILSTVDELAYQHGYSGERENKILGELKGIWKA